ncbi:glycosyltransferase [Phreatobacter sp.]|uniref:glycosyltransferase n=1 Tax=Phreatobacter sp. TaxID=1966341 RepID=UPI003F6ED8E6
MPPREQPMVCVIICTNGRAASLERTVKALQAQTHRSFELCIVHGPANDGTRELVESLAAARYAKGISCPAENIAMARNLGLRATASPVVAFLDDDALPEPNWLEALAAPFSDGTVGAVSGVVIGPDGETPQFRFSVVDRAGRADHALQQPGDAGAYPLSGRFPHVMGANCAFRRPALVSLGGFDEEYDYYLDETDACCRLVDSGWGVRQLDGAVAHHKFLPGAVRDGSGMTTRYERIVKNQLYFSLMNGRCHLGLEAILTASMAFIAHHRRDVGRRIAGGSSSSAAAAAFEHEVERALELGLARGLSGVRRVRHPGWFDEAAPEPCPSAHEGLSSFAAQSVMILPSRDIDAAGFIAGIKAARARVAGGEWMRVITVLPAGADDWRGVDLDNGVWMHWLTAPRDASGGLRADLADLQIEAALTRIARHAPIHKIERHGGAGPAGAG